MLLFPVHGTLTDLLPAPPSDPAMWKSRYQTHASLADRYSCVWLNGCGLQREQNVDMRVECFTQNIAEQAVLSLDLLRPKAPFLTFIQTQSSTEPAGISMAPQVY